MADIFLKIVNMSISASWIVLAVLLLRLLLKKAPKWINGILWGIVGLRLMMPFSLESVFSLIPSSETISKSPDSPRPYFESGVNIIDNQINGYLKGTYFEGVTRPTGHFTDVTTVLAIVWTVGIAALLIYTVISYLRLKCKIGTAVLLCDNIYQSESVVSPFVLGIFKPKIYLPFKMNEQDMEHVIAHEQAHIRRKDHLWKPFGFLLLTLHWFNPLMWLGYVLLCRDIELACDEKVVKELDVEQKADYSQALLSCSVNRKAIAACPLAFGEVGVKDRVKSVLNYKKPAFWIIVIAVLVTAVVAVCFLTNPINPTDTVLNKLVNLEDYEVIEQEQKNITLTIPLSDLPDSIYSESGKNFGNNAIVAYKSGTTSIYLKEARYSNEGNQNLYFCFDFSFDLPKKQGVLIYPFEITSSGLSSSVKTVDGILRAENGEFADAINDRGQGSNNLIWFYVSTDALKQAQGTIRFDVLLNQITYFLDSSDYTQKLAWTYNPMLSHTGHYTKAFSFDFDYTHIEAACTEGEFWSLDVEDQPRSTQMRFENGETVYWAPSEAAIARVPQKSEVTLAIYNAETQLHKCTVVFECVSHDTVSAEFEIYLKVADGLQMVSYGDGIKLVKQSSTSNVGGVDAPTNVMVSASIDQLKVKYPQFFNISTDGGLTVYIWQMSKNNYKCYLANTFLEAISDNSFAYKVGATIPEMRAILTTYNIDRSEITIQAVRNPLSSYYYKIDDTYQSKVKELFWEEQK